MTPAPDGGPPRVSVIVPAYNAEATLDATLRSVRSQTQGDLEVLVVDDGSTDATSEVIETHAVADPRVRRLGYGGNRGRSAARNHAIDESAGEWVAFVDADDLWAPDRLERLLAAAASHPRSRVVFDDRIGFEVRDGRVRMRDRYVSRATWRLHDGEEVRRRGWLADKFCHMDPMIRRSFLLDGGPRFPEGLSMAEDLCFCMQVAYWPEPTSPLRVGRPGYYYRRSSTTRASGGVWSLRRAIDLAVDATGSAELREVTTAAWPAAAWRFARADRLHAAGGRHGAADPGVERAELGDVAWRGFPSLVWDKGLHLWAGVVDRRLRPGIAADIESQLRLRAPESPAR